MCRLVPLLNLAHIDWALHPSMLALYVSCACTLKRTWPRTNWTLLEAAEACVPERMPARPTLVIPFGVVGTHEGWPGWTKPPTVVHTHWRKYRRKGVSSDACWFEVDQQASRYLAARMLWTRISGADSRRSAPRPMLRRTSIDTISNPA